MPHRLACTSGYEATTFVKTDGSSELIIPATDTPGAKAALVNRWMDQLLAEGLPTQRNAFLAGLSWMATAFESFPNHL